MSKQAFTLEVRALFTTTVRAETRRKALRMARRRLLAQGMAPDPERAWRLVEAPLGRLRVARGPEPADVMLPGVVSMKAPPPGGRR